MRVLIPLLCLLATPVSAIAAYLDIVNGPPSAFKLIRNGMQLEVAPYMVLRAGDEVHVRKEKNYLFEDKENYVLLALEDGTTIRVTFSLTRDEPFLIKNNGIPSLWIRDFMDSVKPWFFQLHKYEITRKSKVIRWRRKRTVTLSVPLLTGGKAKMSAGKRPIHLIWEGGRPPFRVRVYRADTKIVVWEQSGIKGQSIFREEEDLKEGDYELIVSDDSSEMPGRFAVVAEPQPVSPAIQTSNLPDHTKRTLLAAWLATQGEGEWILEAHQLIADIMDSYYPALLVGRALATGYHKNLKRMLLVEKNARP